MKKYILNILLAAGLVMSFAACEQDTIDPLEGIYPKPDHATYTSAVLNGQEKAAATRTLDMTFSGSNGKDLNVQFVVDKFYLAPNTYTAKAENVAGKGNYIIPASKLGGVAIEKGGLTVQTKGDNWTEGVEYYISGSLWLTDGSIVRVEVSFNMAWEEDIDPDTMSDVTSVASEGVTCHTINLFNGAGEMTAQIVLNRADGADIEGTYDVAEYASADLTAGNGFDLTPFGMNMVIGTYYMLDGKAVVINAGEKIVVTKNADLSYTFDLNGVKFYGKPANAATCVDTVASEGVTSHTMTIKDNATDAVIANIVLNRASDATSLVGTYDVAEYASADMTAGNGFDLRPYGMDFFGGTYYSQDGNLVFVAAGEKIKVEALGACYKATMGDYSVIFSITSHTAM